ncbi:hypothetical protein [Sinomonas humi]|uniref:Uncharacterized protein n=1 Tax=Sinomonas humi TaxID=1338436 RepID=A0A0B2AIE3_9MICC|nr:hypothetical protein [Sinomonas humi]KHL01606.1 hypothetical protein LK10_15275 [Sinomonas humi]
MRLKTAALAAACAGMAALGVAAPAKADPGAYGCPAGWQLRTVDYVVGFAANTQFAQKIRAADQNGDGMLCYKLPPSAIPLFSPTFLYEDNTVPVR